MTCVWRDEPCIRTDHAARGLCTYHYGWVYDHGRLEEFPARPPRPPDLCAYCGTPTTNQRRFCTLVCARNHNDPPYELARDTGRLVCRCDPPGPPDDECPRCRRPNLTPERIAYLRARQVAA